MARILVVEDDADVAELLARRLRSYGHMVVTAPSARMAVAKVGIDCPVDVALLDVNLPGTSGFDLLRQLRRHPELDNEQLPAVFLSGAVTDDNKAAAQGLGVAFLSKPFVSGELQGAILQALETANA